MRCAIYTRKSGEEGLAQEFNSLDAQRESAEAYIASQKHAGWTIVAECYDDGGYTGANLDRPALERLLADIEAGGIDCVVVYKVDRLSRSLLDFARLMGLFENLILTERLKPLFLIWWNRRFGHESRLPPLSAKKHTPAHTQNQSHQLPHRTVQCANESRTRRNPNR